MPQQTIDNKQGKGAWYVMIHLSPNQIETMLQKDCDGKFRDDNERPLAPFRFFVPFQHIPVLPTEQEPETDRHYRAQDDRNALRSDLHNFVFIQAPEDRVRAIVGSDWNSKARLHLRYYRDTNHNIVTISDEEMQQLIATIQSRHMQFYIDQPLDDFAAGDKVVLKMEPWEGKHGVVKKVAIKHGQLCMTISMNILGRTKSINFTDVRVGDVLFEDAERGRMLSDNPITNYEEEIIDLLSHRFGKRYNEEMAEGDRQRLRRLSTYDRIYVDDADEHARFVALKLLCAYLLQNAKKRDLYQQQALDLLTSTLDPHPSSLIPHPSSLSPHPSSLSPQPSSFVAAYLMTALFVTTRQARWRDAVKEYRNSHPDCPDVLRRYHAIIKELKAKKS